MRTWRMQSIYPSQRLHASLSFALSDCRSARLAETKAKMDAGAWRHAVWHGVAIRLGATVDAEPPRGDLRVEVELWPSWAENSQ